MADPRPAIPYDEVESRMTERFSRMLPLTVPGR